MIKTKYFSPKNCGGLTKYQLTVPGSYSHLELHAGQLVHDVAHGLSDHGPGDLMFYNIRQIKSLQKTCY